MNMEPVASYQPTGPYKMSAQQSQYAETIRAMKMAMKRRADDSDSDHSVQASTNRGHKLQRRAKYVQSGRLDTTGGTRSYRKKVNHAGYTRNIIAPLPPMYDQNGTLVPPDQLGDAEPIEEDPFGDVMLSMLLRPLTNASLLSEHPSLSPAFTSKGLTQMVDQAAEMLRQERERLWKVKRLLQRFRGDADWVPCEAFETEHDEMLLYSGAAHTEDTEGTVDLGSAAPSLVVGQDALGGEVAGTALEDGLHAMDGIETADMAVQQAGAVKEVVSEIAKILDAGKEPKDESMTNGDEASANQEEITTEDTTMQKTEDSNAALDTQPMDSIETAAEAAEAASEHTSNSGKETNGTNPPQHAMTTRARARSPVRSPSQSPTPSDSASIPPIHPWFMVPPSALPDRDLGLPAPEAEESRRLLLLYVQKQENIVRSLDTLYSGLQRADRVRREIWRACKAEAHMKDDGKGNKVTEMSDGEDWYDPEDWGLDARDLKVGKGGVLGLEKGKDEVDDVGDEAEGRRGGRRRRVNRM